MLGLIRAEGVNFSTTLFDTNDLSTTRGASLALGRLHQIVAQGLASAGARDVHEAFAGASQCLFSFETMQSVEEVAAAVRAAIAATPTAVGPFRHLAIVVDAVGLTDDRKGTRAAAERVLTARNRARQMRSFSVPPLQFSTAPRKPDPLEGIQPATVRAYLPRDNTPENRVLDDTATGEARDRLAPSVDARRSYGRSKRTGFYADELGDRAKGLRVTNSLQDVVANPPEGLPVSVQAKVAVFYADGNKFGRLRDEKGSELFARELGRHRKTFLGHVVDWMLDGSSHEAFGVRNARGETAVRFETLIYGGDELTVVMPAWLIASFVEGFFRAAGAWTIDGTPVTHAAGVAIANVKTPIRQLVSIAKQAADDAKDAGLRETDSVTFEIFESLSPPDTKLEAMRQSLYGAASRELIRHLAIPGRDFAAARRTISALKGDKDGEGFPRSQIYGALRAARRKKSAADEAVREALDAYARRAGAGATIPPSEVRLPCFDPRGRPRALDLAMIAAMWDYATPFAEPSVRDLASFIA